MTRRPPRKLQARHALLGLALITALYLAALAWVDSRNAVFAQTGTLWRILPALCLLAMLSFVLRYLRWRWLLRRSGMQGLAWLRGFAAYLSGFTFTATPGKVGELLRIRYFMPMGVPASRVLAAFVYERLFDLLAVLLLASLLALDHAGLFLSVLLFVACLAALVVAVIQRPAWLRYPASRLHRAGWSGTARLICTLSRGLRQCRTWHTLPDAFVSLMAGILAWGCVSAAFVVMLHALNIALPLSQALGIYPLAMLAGAASMLPGGIGSTEATIIVLLVHAGIAVEAATLAAIGIRLATLWFSIVCGLLCAMRLEASNRCHG